MTLQTLYETSRIFLHNETYNKYCCIISNSKISNCFKDNYNVKLTKIRSTFHTQA
jgi:hypothetical protein